MTARYLRLLMSESSHPLVEEVEKGLDAASETLAGLRWLTPDEAKRIGGHVDRLASQLAAVSPRARADRTD